MRISAIVLALGAVLAASRARAEPLYPRDGGRIEAELELVATPSDGGPEFDELDAVMLFGILGGAYVSEGLRVQLGVRADVADPEADHLEVVAALGWSWVDAPALDVPPALRLGARVELGWRWLELRGSDFIVSDDGLTGALSAEIGVVPFAAFAIVARAGGAFVLGSNGALPDPQIQLRLALAFVGVF